MRKLGLFVLSLVVGVGCGGSSAGGGDDQPPYVPPFATCAGANPTPAAPDGSVCLVDPTMPTSTPPLAVIEQTFEQYNGVDAIHLSIVFDPSFVDNTFGANAVNWSKHNFKDLVGSDHAEVQMFDSSGNLVLEFDLDYISEDPDAPCGFSCLGVDGGDGKMLVGDRAAILGWSSSLDRNLNERGYCLTTDSPASDADCTPNPAAPDWDFRVVYEVWVAVSAFDPDIFGSAYMSFVHASPSKLADNTVDTVPGECPCTEIDPNDCAPPDPPPGDCMSNADCREGEFCSSDGHCLQVIL